MTVFALATEAFEAAQAEFGERVRLIRNAAIPLTAVLSEKHAQVFDADNGALVDTVQYFLDVSVEEMHRKRVRNVSVGDRFEHRSNRYVVVQVLERMGHLRLRLHQETATATTGRAW